MAIIPSMVLPNPPAVSSEQSFTIGLTIENSEADAITINGIHFWDENNILTLGDFSPCLPIKFQVVSGGTPVTSSVPAWGTATQSDVVYYVGNISGSTLQTIQTSGSYGGDNKNFTPVSSSVIIPAGATGSYQVSARAPNTNRGTQNAINFGQQTANVKGRITINNEVRYYDLGNNNIFVFPTDGIIGAELEMTPAPPANFVISAQGFARPENFDNFDAVFSTNLILSNGEKLPLPPWLPTRNNYTSSDPSVISVVAEGAFGATTPSTTLTNSVGSIYGGQNTKLTAGGGAATFTFPVGSQPNSINYATISNEIAAGLTASLTIGLQETALASIQVVPNFLSIQSGSIVPTKTFYTLTDGTIYQADGNQIPYPTFVSSQPNAVAVNASGSITGSVDAQANVLITATLGSTTTTLSVVLNKIV